MSGVDALVASGRPERVPADAAAVRARLARAQQHLTTAARLVGQDDEAPTARSTTQPARP